MALPDILFFMSDQHTPYYSGFYGNNVDTPNMDQLARDGVTFREAYTTCPLCVPSRVSMLSGLRPARTGIFTLDDALPDLTPTFLHYLVEQGYETVLAGRMHYVGADQRHGFTKRIAGDLTTISWNSPRDVLQKNRGVFVRAFGEVYCTTLVGGGASPVECYDDYVIAQALDYLSRPHDKPQFLAVSLYAPHFPYVGQKSLYEKYCKKAKLSPSFYDKIPTLIWERHYQKVEEPLALAAQAAYCAMIESLDGKLGRVRQAFDRFCREAGRAGLFLYLSDHGDQCGDRSMFAKSTFYEKSAKIPLIIAGAGVQAGLSVDIPVSIMDVGPTLLEYTGARPMEEIDGVSLVPALRGETLSHGPVYGEFLERAGQGTPADRYCFMIKEGPYKYICFRDDPATELLFHTINDPEERQNLIEKLSDVSQHMRMVAQELSMPEEAVRIGRAHQRNVALWKAYEKACGTSPTEELWCGNPEYAKQYPELCMRRDIT